MNYWWILYGYLIAVAIAGRFNYFHDRASIKLIEKRIETFGGKNQTQLRAAAKNTKIEVIFEAFLGLPLLALICIPYYILDTAFYLLILAPMGFKNWRSGFGYNFLKKTRKYDLPWWTASYILESTDSQEDPKLQEIRKTGGIKP